MYIPNDDTQNYIFCKWQLVVDTLILKLIYQNVIKVSKVNKKRNYRTLGISVIKSQMSPRPCIVGCVLYKIQIFYHVN